MANRFPMSDDEDDDEEDDDTVNKLDDDEINEENDAETNCRSRLGYRHYKSKRRTTSFNDESLPSDNMRDRSRIDCNINFMDDHFCNINGEIPNCVASTDSNLRDSRLAKDAYLINFPRQEAYSVLYGNNHW